MDKKIQFNYRVNSNLASEFDDLTKRLGGDKYAFAEAALKVLLSLPDPVINYLKQANTSLTDAEDYFAGFQNREILLDFMRDSMLNSPLADDLKDDEDFKMWQQLIDLVNKTYKQP